MDTIQEWVVFRCVSVEYPLFQILLIQFVLSLLAIRFYCCGPNLHFSIENSSQIRVLPQDFRLLRYLSSFAIELALMFLCLIPYWIDMALYGKYKPYVQVNYRDFDYSRGLLHFLIKFVLVTLLLLAALFQRGCCLRGANYIRCTFLYILSLIMLFSVAWISDQNLILEYISCDASLLQGSLDLPYNVLLATWFAAFLLKVLFLLRLYNPHLD